MGDAIGDIGDSELSTEPEKDGFTLYTAKATMMGRWSTNEHLGR